MPIQYRDMNFPDEASARWAIFFDALGMEYELWPPGNAIYDDLKGALVEYQALFYLPEREWFIDVVPRDPGSTRLDKAHRFARNEVDELLPDGTIQTTAGPPRRVILIEGEPRSYVAYLFEHPDSEPGFAGYDGWFYAGLNCQSLWWAGAECGAFLLAHRAGSIGDCADCRVQRDEDDQTLEPALYEAKTKLLIVPYQGWTGSDPTAGRLS